MGSKRGAPFETLFLLTYTLRPASFTSLRVIQRVAHIGLVLLYQGHWLQGFGGLLFDQLRSRLLGQQIYMVLMRLQGPANIISRRSCSTC